MFESVSPWRGKDGEASYPVFTLAKVAELPPSPPLSFPAAYGYNPLPNPETHLLPNPETYP